MNEGWAEYYSTVRVVDGVVQIGAALPDKTLTTDSTPFVAQAEGLEVVAIPIAMLPPPSQLMAMSGEHFYDLSSDETSDFEASLGRTSRYLGAWAFVHMLLDGKNPYAERFKLFQNEVLDSTVEDAWARAFAGVSARELDEYFLTYLATSKLTAFGRPYQNNVINQSSVRSLSDGEVHLLWARLHSVNLGAPAADTATLVGSELSLAVKAAPDLPEAHHWQGLLALAEQRWDAAHGSFTRAVSLDPNEPRFLVSQLRLELMRRDGKLQPNEIEALLPKFDRLLTVAKSAQQLLIAAHYEQARGNTEQALALGQRAMAQEPIDPLVLDNYATLLEDSGRFAEALEVQRHAVAFISDGEEAQRAALRQHLETLEAHRAAHP